MKKKLCSFLLCFLLLVPFCAFPANAAYFSVKERMGTDAAVYAPGVYDLYVYTDAEEPTFQWCVRVGSYGSSYASVVRLEDSDKYSGVRTDHLSLLTNDGLAYTEDGNGWNELSFFCRVTDKSGTSRDGPDMKMVVFTHQKMLEKIEQEGVKLTRCGVNNSLSSRVVDGVTYYDCSLDKGVAMSSSFSLLSKEGNFKKFFEASEGEFRMEYVITEDGNTTSCFGAPPPYMPKKAGMGRVQVTGNLVLFVNGNRMETIDSRSFVVNVLEPAGMGYGYTTAACSVLADQYSQARVIERLEKGRAVHLIADTGSYYQVVVNGYLGYVPKTAVSIPEKVPFAAIASIAEPSEYANPDFSPVLLDPDCYELYQTEPVTWNDNTANRFLAPGDTFLPGHTYSLSVWLKAKSGHSFSVSNGSPAVSATVNNRTAKAVTAYEQDPEEVIEILYTFTHVHNPQKVPQKYPTCTAAGKSVYYRCGCGMEYEDYQAKKVIESSEWGVIPPLGHRESEWKSNGTSHYKVCLRRECGEVIEGSMEKHRGGVATCTSGKYCSVCGLEYGAKGTHSWSNTWDYVSAEGHAHACEFICGTVGPLQSHVPGPAATATTPQTCKECGYILAPATNHTHALTKVEAKDATCTSPGNIEYYTCSGCNEIFKDKDGKETFASPEETVLAPLGHVVSDEWHFSDTEHWRVCTRCGESVIETKALHDWDEKAVCRTCSFDKNDPSLITEDPDAPLPVKPTDPPAPSSQNEKEDPGKEESGGVPWWAIVLAAVLPCLIAVGAAFGVNAVRKKKEERSGPNKAE